MYIYIYMYTHTNIDVLHRSILEEDHLCCEPSHLSQEGNVNVALLHGGARRATAGRMAEGLGFRVWEFGSFSSVT